MSAVEEAGKVLAERYMRREFGANLSILDLDQPEAMQGYRALYSKHAQADAEALAAAGLLPEGETRTEWRVESESLEDEFGEDEARAREWLAITRANPEWEPAVLKRRVVTVTVGPWTEVQP